MKLERQVRKDTANLTGIKLIINSGFRFVYPFLPAIGRGLGVDLNQMGVLLSVRWGVGFAVPLAVGTSHSAGRSRRLLMGGLIVFGVGSLLTALLGTYAGAILGFALVGLGKPVFDIGSQTYISERVAYERRARVLGILELSWAGGLLIGAPVAGWLIDRWGWEAPFLVFGSLALLSIGALLLALDESDDQEDAPVSGADQPLAVVLPFLAVVLIAGFTLELVLVVLGTWLEIDFGMTLLALAGVGFLLGVAELAGEGAMVLFTDRWGKRNSFAIGLGATSLALIGLGLNTTAVLGGLVALFVVMMSLEFSVISGIPLASEYRPSNRSRFLAWFLVAAGIGRIIADLLGPVVFASSGMRAIAFLAAGSAALGAMLLLVLVKEVDALQTVRPPL